MRSSTVLLAVALTGCSVAPELAPDRVGGSSERVLDPGCAGSAYATIQSAIDAAVDGDIVEVCAGTFHERLTISGKALTLRSINGAATSVIDAQGLGTTLTVSGGADVTVEALTLSGGHSGAYGGDLYCTGSTLAVTDSVVTGGSANIGGGLASSCAGSVTGTTFSSNTAAWVGGGVWISGDDVVFQGNTLSLNSSIGGGGGLYLDGSSALLDNVVDANHTDFRGGGVTVHAGFGDISGNTVTANTCLDDGAGIFVEGGGPLVSDNVFEGNDADDEGGGLRVKLSTATIVGNTFTGNHADYRGGAIKISHEAATLDDNDFTSNTAWSYGGALVLEESASLVTNSLFRTNDADDGGAVQIENGWGDVTFEDCRFIGNSADDHGGTFYVTLPLETLVLRRVEIATSDADYGGALYAIGSGGVRIENSVLRLDEAGVSGGGLYLDATPLELVNSVFFRDTAPTGAAITIANGLASDVTNTVFNRGSGGPTFRLESGTIPTIRYSDFAGNGTDFSGLASVIGTNGNKAFQPRFTSAGRADFTLLATSRLIDMGDPAISDLDGTRSDMGLYGGPASP